MILREWIGLRLLVWGMRLYFTNKTMTVLVNGRRLMGPDPELAARIQP
jgi:hypothetical protein